MMTKLQEAWRIRSAKEKRLLILGGVALFIALLYHGVYKPLNTSINQTEQNLINDIELLEWMQTMAPKVLAARGGAKPSFQGSLFALAEKQFKNLADESPRITREDESTVSVAFTQVPFDRLMMTLQQLQAKEGVSIERFRATAGDEIGWVQASFKLTR